MQSNINDPLDNGCAVISKIEQPNGLMMGTARHGTAVGDDGHRHGDGRGGVAGRLRPRPRH